MISAFVPARHAGAVQRIGAVARRNVSALPSGYWMAVLSGFAEPLLYLLAVGVGVGRLVGRVPLPDGRPVSYATFVAPAMLAASAMNGAIAESTFNLFGKMKYMRLYEGVLATPVRPLEIALGELVWAMLRGAVYSAAFLAVMVAMRLASPGWALAALPATMLVGFSFGGLGIAVATLMRSWQDFDLLATVQFALFLFSGTFAPLTAGYPAPVRLLIEATPLYHAVELVRGLTTGSVHPALLGHAGYLVAMAALGLLAASRRMGRMLLR